MVVFNAHGGRNQRDLSLPGHGIAGCDAKPLFVTYSTADLRRETKLPDFAGRAERVAFAWEVQIETRSLAERRVGAQERLSESISWSRWQARGRFKTGRKTQELAVAINNVDVRIIEWSRVPLWISKAVGAK